MVGAKRGEVKEGKTRGDEAELEIWVLEWAHWKFGEEASAPRERTKKRSPVTRRQPLKSTAKELSQPASLAVDLFAGPSPTLGPQATSHEPSSTSTYVLVPGRFALCISHLGSRCPRQLLDSNQVDA